MNATRTTLDGGWRAVLWLREPQNEPALRELLIKLIADPASLPGYASLKYSASGEVLRADASLRSGVVQVVCKLSRVSNFARLLTSRARKNAGRAQVLLSAGINTAQPLALLERGRESWLITEYLPDLVDLDQLALTVLPRLEAWQAHELKRRAIEQIADLFTRLMENGLHHRDLKASNILLSGLPGLERRGQRELRTVILDLDGLRTWTLARKAAERARLARLAASLLQYRSITRTDYARFLQAYLDGAAASSSDWRADFRDLARRAFAYNRQAQTRKSDKLDGYAG